MTSGVGVHDQMIEEYNSMKMKKTYLYLICHIEDGEIRILSKGDRSKTFDDFKGEMMQAVDTGDCRYGIYDAEFKTVKEARDQQKLILVSWCPDSSKVKNKMLYSSSKDALKKKLNLEKDLHASDSEELSFENIVAKFQ